MPEASAPARVYRGVSVTEATEVLTETGPSTGAPAPAPPAGAIERVATIVGGTPMVMHASTPPSAEKPKVSVIVPGLNESESLEELANRIVAVLESRVPYEIIFVDDGSTDDSWQIITELHRKNPKIKGARLRKNFGKATALTAG